MPVSISHALSATTPDNNQYEIRPSHWNSNHIATVSVVGSEISGAFGNAGGVSFGYDGTNVTAAAPAGAPSPVIVTAGGSQGTLGTIVFSNSNGVSFGLNGSTITATVGTNYQSTGNYLTTAAQSNQVVNSLNGSTGQISLATGSSLSSSQNGSTITFGLASNITTALQSAGAYLTTAMRSDAVTLSNIKVSAGASSANLSALTFSNSNNVSFGLNGSVITASASGVGGGGVVLYDGVNSITSGTALFSDANNVSFGINGQTVTASINVSNLTVAGNLSQSSNGSTITISALPMNLYAVGNTTQSSSGTMDGGTVSIRGTGGVSVGVSGGSIVISGATGGGAGGAAVSIGGNSTSAGAGYSNITSGTAVLMGGNNITLSQNGASITISGANVGGAQTGISGLQNSQTTYTSGTVALSEGGGAITIASGTGQKFLFSVPQTSSIAVTGNASISTNGSTISIGANAAAVSIGGNSTSAGAGYSNVSTGTLILAGGNNITLSQNGASVTISAANAGGAQTGISGIIASNTTYTSGSVYFSNAGNITISSSVNGASQYVVLSGNAAQTSQSAVEGIGVSNAGNTAGNVGYKTGIDYAFAGSGSITLSQSTAAGSATMWIQHPAWITTYAAQTNQTLSAIVSSNTVGNTSGMTFDARSLSLQGYGAASVGLSTTNTGSTIMVSVPNVVAQTTQSAIKGIGIGSTGNTLGNTGISTGIDWWLAASGAITASQSTSNATGPHTMWMSVASQTNQTGNLYVTANSTQLSSTAGIDHRSLSFAGAGIASVGVSQGVVVVSVPSVGGGVVLYDGANSITSGTARFTNANGVSFSINGQTISGSVASQSNQTLSFAATSNTAGNTSGMSNNATGITMAGYGAASVGYSTSAGGSSIVFSAPATSSIVGVNGISVSTNGSTISVLPQWVSSYENMPDGLPASTVITLNGASISQAVPFYLPENGSFSFIRIPVAMTTNSTTIATTAATLSASAAVYSTWNAVVYSLGTGANSKSLTSVASGSVGWTVRNSISVAVNGTQYSVTQGLSGNAEGGGTSRSTQYSISNSNYSFSTNQIFTEWSGTRFIDINFANSLTAGAYWLVFGLSTSSASNSTGMGPATNCNVGYSNHYGNSQPNIWFGIMGSTNLTSGGLFGGGSFSTVGGGTTAGFPISAISSSASNNKPYFQMLRSA
jgi:fibronectin-binding autotransporter adhesin